MLCRPQSANRERRSKSPRYGGDGGSGEAPPVSGGTSLQVCPGGSHRKPLRLDTRETGMRLERFTFGSIRIDDVTYRQDVVIDRGRIRKRSKKPSKPFRDTFGHTPLSVEEKIP